MAVKKALSNCSKLQSCVRAAHRAEGSTREQLTGTRLALEGCTGLSRGFGGDNREGHLGDWSPTTPSPRVAAVSSIPVLLKAPLGSSGVHSGGFGDTAVPRTHGMCPRTGAGAGRERQQQRQQELIVGTKQLPEGLRGQKQLTSS